nr:DNA-processing protein DprA [Labedaea rhizosphaerae]
MRVVEPPAPALAALVDKLGPVEAADRVRSGHVPDCVDAETSARREQDLVANDFALAEGVGARLVIPEDPEWPAWPLLPLAQATLERHRCGLPLGLWARGPVPLNEALDRAVSVVGARAATGYGAEIAAEFGHGLANAGMTVVSGAANGIDGAAHRGALAARGPTVAVLACGVTINYPASNSSLIDAIAERGLVLSEYAPGVPPGRHRFLVRNRLIACLGAGTVVVEANLRSGARNTAATAAALGRVVLAVPGPITSAMSAGCHELLRTGQAVAVTSVKEIVDSCGPLDASPDDRDRGEARVTDALAPEALRAFEALSIRTGRSPEHVALASGIPLPRIRSLLPELELTGFAARVESGWVRAVPAG